MKILLAIDDSPCSHAAIEMVTRQFRPAESQVRILNVDEWPKGLPTPVAFAQGPGAANALIAAHADVRRRAEALVGDASSELRAAGFAATTEIREGDAPRAILDCAQTWQPDVIVLGSHGRKGLDRLLGSVSDHVLHHAPCSVEVVRD